MKNVIEMLEIPAVYYPASLHKLLDTSHFPGNTLTSKTRRSPVINKTTNSHHDCAIYDEQVSI